MSPAAAASFCCGQVPLGKQLAADEPVQFAGPQRAALLPAGCRPPTFYMLASPSYFTHSGLDGCTHTSYHNALQCIQTLCLRSCCRVAWSHIVWLKSRARWCSRDGKCRATKGRGSRQSSPTQRVLAALESCVSKDTGTYLSVFQQHVHFGRIDTITHLQGRFRPGAVQATPASSTGS
jgi:hypothetical protein